MKTSLIFLTLVFPLLAWAGSSDDIFHEGNYLSAKKMAKQEGKIQLLEFVAEWCLPCKHMDQTTFSDPAVMTYMKANFVNVKVDIDQFDGFALKEEFNVRYLPTVVLVSPDGKVIGKIEEALAPKPFLDKLQALNSKKPTGSTDLPDHKIEKDIPERPVKPQVPVDNEISEVPSQKLLLQFGVFGDRTNAEALVKKITKFLPSIPEVRMVSSNGRELYKVVYGPFSDETEAEDLKADLEKDGIESIIKPLE